MINIKMLERFMQEITELNAKGGVSNENNNNV